MASKLYGTTEIDHIDSLELGGSNDIANLYPKPGSGPANYHAKDKLETKPHDLVCAGSMTLHAAQVGISRNWEMLYKSVYGARGRKAGTVSSPGQIQVKTPATTAARSVSHSSHRQRARRHPGNAPDGAAVAAGLPHSGGRTGSARGVRIAARPPDGYRLAGRRSEVFDVESGAAAAPLIYTSVKSVGLAASGPFDIRTMSAAGQLTQSPIVG
jgi:hypothetical protein